MMQPGIDVLVPCYNYARFLPECLASVLSQTGVDVRVLIIDDASTDDTAEVGAELARRDARVEFVRHRVNKGHIATYNEGIEWVRQTYWMLLSADDMLLPGALRRAAAVMERHPNVGLTYGRAFLLRPNRDLPAFEDVDLGEHHLMTGHEYITHVCETTRNAVPTPTAVVRTAIQKTIGGYLPELPHTGDMEMWLRVAAYADVCAIATCQAVYRWHGANMQFDYQKPVLGDLPEYWHAFETVLGNHSKQIAGANALRRSVSRSLATEAFWRGSLAFDRGETVAFRSCIEFARACCPELTTSSQWRHMRAKALVGPRVWSWFRPLSDRVRRVPAHEPQRARTPVDVIGSWPGGPLCSEEAS